MTESLKLFLIWTLSSPYLSSISLTSSSLTPHHEILIAWSESLIFELDIALIILSNFSGYFFQLFLFLIPDPFKLRNCISNSPSPKSSSCLRSNLQSYREILCTLLPAFIILSNEYVIFLGRCHRSTWVDRAELVIWPS